MEKQQYEPVLPSKGFKYEKNKRDRQHCHLHKPQEFFVSSQYYQLDIPSGTQHVVEGRRSLCALWMQVKWGHDQYAFFLYCSSLFTSKNYVENLAPGSQKHAICHFYLNECQVSLYVFGGRRGSVLPSQTQICRLYFEIKSFWMQSVSMKIPILMKRIHMKKKTKQKKCPVIQQLSHSPQQKKHKNRLSEVTFV